MIENVVCNHKNPLENMRRMHAAYQNATFVFDTKMSEFHNQTMELFLPEWDWLLRERLISHMHINDYNGGYMDWNNLRTLPVGAGKIDFTGFLISLHNMIMRVTLRWKQQQFVGKPVKWITIC